ncbi:MAG: type II secretion system F family protein [Planctomycetota bacterium]
MPLPLDAFYTALAATVGSALPLPKALASAGRPDLAPLADGRPLADILAAGGIPELDVATVRAAETTGRLEAALKGLARRAREALILKRRLRAILIYPLIVMHGMVIAPWVIQWIFATASVALLLYNLAGIWVLFFIVRAILSSRIAESLPVAGPIRRDVACARFCDALAGALDAALPMKRAIELAADAAGGPTGVRARAAAAGDVNRPLVETLAPVLPLFSIEMLRAGEEAGSIDKALAKLAQRHFEDAVHALNKLVAVLPLILFFVTLACFVLQLAAIGGPVFHPPAP